MPKGFAAVVNQSSDGFIRDSLDLYAQGDAEFWSFRGKAVRKHAHALFQYPAMMVPDMQGVLIETVRNAAGNVQSAYDPFVGSGTTLTESMIRGMDFTGGDINPLAVLICRVKAGPLHQRTLSEQLEELLGRIRNDRRRAWETELLNVRKWFRLGVVGALSRIRRGIRGEPSLWARRFFWVALAEIVRPVSNSRTSTFKLHIRPQKEIDAQRECPITLFEEVARRNLERLVAQRKLLAARNLLKGATYRGEVSVHLRDATACNGARGHDLLITSPPYGDNKSTVPYGQYSYLPLHWIDGGDIDPAWRDDCLASTHTIDFRSLGGSLVVAKEAIRALSELSPSFRRTVRRLKEAPRDRLQRVSSFCHDLNHTLHAILTNLRPGGYMIWTVGNRRVGGEVLPFDRILTELLEARGSTLVAAISRRIPSKRMAVRNSVSDTMRHESILILRK
jgi:hypothetical protein